MKKKPQESSTKSNTADYKTESQTNPIYSEFEFIVKEEQSGIRLDKFLAESFFPIKPEITRTRIQTLFDEDLVFDENHNPIKTLSQKTKVSQRIFVKVPPAKPSHLEAREIPFKIIYEDDDLIVIDKPAGLTVHPGAGNRDDTLVNALLFTHKNKLSGINGEFRPGIVHRLDKDTSGLMIIAKNDLTHQALSNMLKDRIIKRTYLAFIYGIMNPTRGTIRKNITRHKNNRLKMSISRNEGRVAITNYETKETFCENFISLVECRLETGRTHQIRIHLESEKHSLIGDKLYNSCKKTAPASLSPNIKNLIEEFPRQALHSYKINFIHPISQKEISLEIPFPQDLKNLYDSLKK